MNQDELNRQLSGISVLVLFLAVLIILQTCINIATAVLIAVQYRRVQRLLDLAERHGVISDHQKKLVTVAARDMIKSARETREVTIETKEAINKLTPEGSSSQLAVAKEHVQ